MTPKVPEYTDELPESEFEDSFLWMNRANNIWFEHVKPESIAAAERIKALDACMLVSGHGPVERKDLSRICNWIKQMSDMTPLGLANHEEFGAMLHTDEPKVT